MCQSGLKKTQMTRCHPLTFIHFKLYFDRIFLLLNPTGKIVEITFIFSRILFIENLNLLSNFVALK